MAGAAVSPEGESQQDKVYQLLSMGSYGPRLFRKKEKTLL